MLALLPPEQSALLPPPEQPPLLPPEQSPPPVAQSKVGPVQLPKIMFPKSQPGGTKVPMLKQH